MSNVIFISSVVAAVIWALCYMLIEASPAVHIFLIAAFIGTVISVYLDEKKQISRNSN
ncbi:MAG TPA: hypothetical protein PLY34_06620 [Ferruginibacter sp.]|jgi:hypothetical protein|nr:hypothetical protein [Ferruginibacter sp.]HPH91154.1 hypothetical protein [Ferruginibacter sp.]